MEPRFFSSSMAFRRWLERHHDTETELWVGFFRKATGKQTMSYAEAVDQALCFGWIDGVRKPFDEESYMQRFTPRRRQSNWSAVNVAKVAALTKQGLMSPAGLAAFERRRREESAYSYERRGEARFDESQLARFRANKSAWRFFSAQAPWYRRTATHWVVSAKREDTRERRLGTLIADSEAGRRLRQLSNSPKQT